MKKILLLILFGFFFQCSKTIACNANFTHTYACAGDTVFFEALDQFAVYTWDFGDSISGAGNISHDTDSYHIFVNPGTYYVTLFVNIGAEWDYKTQILQIGTECFGASFSETCAGNNDFNFTNESTGTITSSLWNFGDPASGIADTSTLLNPYHQYPSPGTYTVTLVVSDGVQSDTLIKQVTVQPTCLNATFYNFLGGDCVQNVTTINVYYAGSPLAYYWDFGDPATGIANYSSDSLGVHQFSAAGIYLVTLIVTDGLRTDTFFNVQDIIDCDVYPGNANRDGEVNMEDLFAIGVSFNDTGAVRSNASNNWTAQSCTDWSASNWTGYMYLQDLVDKKNADCNGDGIINALDIAVLNQNYGLQIPNYSHTDEMIPLRTIATDPVLEVNPGTGVYFITNTVSLSIDLSALDSVRSIYGIAARIYYDPAYIVPGSVSVSFSNSWMGTEGVDLIGLYKDFYNAGYVDFGMVRTNKIVTTGNGSIATLTFTLNAVTGTPSFSFDPAIKLITAGSFSSQEIFRPANTNATSILTIVTGMDEIENSAVLLYPNPASKEINVSMKNGSALSNWSIVDALGKTVLQGLNSDFKNPLLTISTASLADGIYTVKIISDGALFQKKISIVR